MTGAMLRTRCRAPAVAGAALALAVIAMAMAPPGVGADTTSCVGGPCGPAHQQCGPPLSQPAYHISDETCAENDPNGPMYDPVHSVFHHFWQAHLAEPADGHGRGPDWGHAVSRDFVHWARMPVAIWNDQPYDEVAIYTGSTTIVDGKPVIIYPGLCVKEDYAPCDTGTVLAVAVPEDPSDPLYTNWTKPSYNPIVQNTQRDPSTAWQTPSGEWRIVTYDSTIYASMDFKSWTDLGALPGFPGGECPSFFPLPPATPGSEALHTSGPGASGAAAPTTPQPTHVHKVSHGGQDWMQPGVYTPGAPGALGSFNATGPEQLIDAGAFYASKDMWDPVKGRRINWGWARVPPQSTQTLPREVTWNPTLGQLVFAPVAEQAQLRGASLASMKGVAVPAGGSVWLGDWAAGAGKQAEVVATFDIPASGAATFGIDVMAGAGSSGSSGDGAANVNVSTRVFVQFDGTVGAEGAPTHATVGVGSPTPAKNLTKYMPGIDLPGGDYNVTNVRYSDPKTCEAVCGADSACVAWTYVTRPPLTGSCCLKHTGFGYNPHPADPCTSGVKVPQPVPGPGPAGQSVLRLMPADTVVEVRVFVDTTFIEVYFAGGRVALTHTFTGAAQQAGMALWSTQGGATAAAVDVWPVGSIWVSPEEVLRAPRFDSLA